MRLTVIFRTLGVLFVLFSTTMIPPLALSLWDADGLATNFSLTLLVVLGAGLALWLPQRHSPDTIRNRDGFVIVALMWSAMSLLGAVPFMLALDVGFPDALFESASGFTTTGSTVLTGLDEMPRSILLFRQQLQWLGGIGVIVLAIALLPVLGVGGMQLYKAETPGPLKDERITPRIARTSKGIVVIYVLLTALCGLSYWLGGMDVFDAVAHSLTTLSTGGFSTHDASLAYFESPTIESLATLFMFIGGVSFSLHFVVWRSLDARHYGRDTQLVAYVWTTVVLAILIGFELFESGSRGSLLHSLRLGLFEVVSVITTTGFSVTDFSVWPFGIPVLLIFASFIGGCAGSTAGGMKVIRFVIMGKQAGAHLRKLIHPQAIGLIKIDGRVVQESVIEGIWGFFTIYVAVFVLFMILLMIDGLDQVTAFGAVATCMNNLGPGLGDVASDFASVSGPGKCILVLAMLFGRLEIFTLLVLLTPDFWRS